MTELSRRTVLQVGGGAAIAVPITVLATRGGAPNPIAGSAAATSVSAGVAGGTVTGEPVMFCVHDARTGEVSVLHGTSEVIVRDSGLVARILAAVEAVPSSSVVAATTTGI